MLFDHGENSGQGWRNERGAAKDIGLAVGAEETAGAGALAADDVPVVLRSRIERNVGKVARRVVGDAEACLPGGLGKEAAGAATAGAAGIEAAGRGGLIPGLLGDITF